MSINTRSYGDVDNVSRDVKALHDIIARQGSHLVTACLAESIGNTALKFGFTFNASKRVLESVVEDLREQTLERI